MSKIVKYFFSFLSAALGALFLVAGIGKILRYFNDTSDVWQLLVALLLIILSAISFYFSLKILKPDSVVSLVVAAGLLIILSAPHIKLIPAPACSALSEALPNPSEMKGVDTESLSNMTYKFLYGLSSCNKQELTCLLYTSPSPRD